MTRVISNTVIIKIIFQSHEHEGCREVGKVLEGKATVPVRACTA